MAERICALLGSGKGPRVPVGVGARLEVSGGAGEFSLFFDNENNPQQMAIFEGDQSFGLYDGGFVQIEHNGPASASFFVLR